VSYKGAQRAASTIIGGVCSADEEGFCAVAVRAEVRGRTAGRANGLPGHSKEVMP
jgi:hypothetical protein